MELTWTTQAHLSGAVMSTRGDRKSDHACRVLKHAILTLKLPPGGLLVEADLMKEFGVGRTPLREALQRLAAEGLVVSVPRRGMFVAPVTSDDVQSVYELRCNLDALAASLAARRATAEEVREMETLLELAGATANADPVAFDEQMHELIVSAAHNSYLLDIHRRLYALSIRLFNLRQYKRETLTEMCTELRVVVDGIRRRDPDAAARAAREHITSRGWFPNLET